MSKTDHNLKTKTFWDTAIFVVIENHTATFNLIDIQFYCSGGYTANFMAPEYTQLIRWTWRRHS